MLEYGCMALSVQRISDDTVYGKLTRVNSSGSSSSSSSSSRAIVIVATAKLILDWILEA